MSGKPEDLIRHRVAMLYGNALPGAAMSLLATMILCRVYWAMASQAFLLGWLACISILLAVRVLLAVRYRQGAGYGQQLRWAWVATGTVGLSGLAWGMAGLVLVGVGTDEASLFFCCMGLGAVLTVSGYIAWWPAHLAFHVPLFLLTAAGFFLTGRSTAQWLALACIALCLTCAFIGHRLSRIFGRILDISARSERMATVLGAQALALEAANAKLRHLSDTDFLTGLWNRRRMMVELTQQHGQHGILLIDVDHFKAYNDELGHAAGDACLREVAHVAGRVVDRHGGTIGRHGGEEFLVLLPVASDMVAIGVAEELRLAIAAIHAGDGVAIPRGVTVSIGVATADSAVAASLRLEAADRALYAAKKAGRNRVMAFRGQITVSHAEGRSVA
ncbi:GGDEF domain-containing protein [Sphingobium aromaticiconvertens]|uniref:GGDEF domain-containing protein n=1 Tax=Sphingobium aromaticiconvertens TaxID=365341 RepID=UPI0030162DD1